MTILTKKIRMFFVISLCLQFVTIAFAQKIPGTSPHEQVADWKVVGPGGGGGVFLPTVSPLNENLVLAHCDMTGAYISDNGGQQWRMFQLWTVPVDFKYHPANPNIIYAATKGYRHGEERGSGLSILYRSANRGKSWEIVYPVIENRIKDLAYLQSLDLLPAEAIAGAENASINKVAIDPAAPQKIYLGLSALHVFSTGGQEQKKADSVIVIGSFDEGKVWKRITKLPGKEIKQIFPSPVGSINKGLLVFTDSVSFFIDEITGNISPAPLPVSRIRSVKGDGQTIYIQSSIKQSAKDIQGGMFVSRDGGKSWKQINNGLVRKNMAMPRISRGFDVCASRPGVAYLSVERKETRNEQRDELIFAIYKTIDFGEHWQPVLLSSTPRGYITGNFSGGWMEQSFDPGWGTSPIDLGVAPSNPDICYASDEGRAYKTTDGGVTWQQVYSQTQADGSAASIGLDVTTAYGIHFDPFDKEHFFLCYTDIGLFNTFNGGKSWSHAVTGIPRDWENTCYQVVFDPVIKGKAWSVWASAHDLPREKMFSAYGFDEYKGGVAISANGGQNWKKSNDGIPEHAICTNILLDPSSQPGNRTLYACVFDKGVYKSTDDGKTWTKKNTGLGENLFSWQLRRAASGRLYLLNARGWRKDRALLSGSIYFSDDNADSWQQLALPQGVTGPHDLLISPWNENEMYVSCWPARVEGKDRFGGVLKSIDKGKTWQQVFDGRVRVNSAAADPSENGRIYINTFQNAAWMSNNKGSTWERMGGYRFKWGQRVVPDIHHPGYIYLTTYGGSVFYGQAKGVDGEFVDIVNMPEG